jgi:predicted nicotinamide N-methyase
MNSTQVSSESSAGDYILFHDNSAGSFELEVFGCPVSLRQSPASRDLGHGAVVWEASVIFAKYMEHHGGKLSDLKGKTAIELGSGCGLGGLALAMRGAQVVMTDLPRVVESLTAPNAQVSLI